MIVLKVLLIIVFGIIFFQDYSTRMVHWFWYPLVGFLGFFIQKEFVQTSVILINSGVNLSLILTVLLILWVYSKIILKKKLVNESIGIGDILFFIFLSFCFSVISFFVLFVFSLIFSLLLHFAFKSGSTKHKTIPLAGYMAVFFAFVYGVSFFVNCNILFAY